MRRALALALLAGLLAPPARADSPWQAELAGQQEWQQWRETGGDGRRLLTEDGRLSGLSASWRWAPPGSATVALRLGVLRGARDYRGFSNQGNEVQTRSDVGHDFVRVEGGPAPWPLAGGWHGQALAAAELWQWRRHLRDAGSVSGYPEHYRQGLLLVGLQAASDSGWQLGIEAGGGPRGRNRVQLPGRDPAELPLGSVRTWRASLGDAFMPGWRWALTAERLTLGAGEEKPITLQGVPLQSARQPRTELRRLQLQLIWQED
ncbi:hypothetical protein J2X20_000226 [Pelomonas saccharophila]|uniref:Uncharacterized protein n=1 Tax=Roseateles saccharophilus TaxID=304 RepID=A0ABU1YFG8_ROSSA|nr:hypothetical protein [Roseateles saccharophilus]MDR7267597.1 hypothetical protein [Roseateles saccharophilus]